MQLCRPLPAFVGRSVRNIGTAAADTGKTGTHLYHSINGLLAIAFPIAVLSDGRSVTGKTAGVFTAGAVSFHSWVGLHYVITVSDLYESYGVLRIVFAIYEYTTEFILFSE